MDPRIKLPKQMKIETATRSELEEKCRQLLKDEYKFQSLKFEFYNPRTKKKLRSRMAISDEVVQNDMIMVHVGVQTPGMVRLRFGSARSARERQSFHQDERMIEVKRHFIESQRIKTPEEQITMYFNDLEIDNELETLSYYNIKREGEISFRYTKE